MHGAARRQGGSGRTEGSDVSEQVPGGVDLPTDEEGRRSSSAFGRELAAAALRGVDPTGAQAAERETNWRSGYIDHLRRLTEAGVASPGDARTIAADGLAAVHGRMVVRHPEGDRPITDLRAATPVRDIADAVITGTGEAEQELALPYRGELLTGDRLRRQLDDWASRGVVEPTVAAAIERVLERPDWLRLDGHTVVVMGAGAELAPLRALLRWGATVAALDLPRRSVWDQLLGYATDSAGTLHLPVDAAADRDGLPDLAAHAGLDLIGAVPAAADWVASLDGVPVLGTYAYADGVRHLQVTVAIDALNERVRGARPDAALAYLATPTDAFVVPAEAVAASVAAYEARSRAAKLVARPLRTVSGGRLLKRNYVPDVDPGICDALVPQQGPNYALAKRIQRWRATAARAEGALVSLNVAPSTRTRSVLKNRVLAAAYAGAHRFGIEIFEPATTNVLMAALLVHDLHTGGGPELMHPWQQEANAAVHGGLWRAPYAPRSALGLATVLGVGASRG
jgi:hypothetical protein